MGVWPRPDAAVPRAFSQPLAAVSCLIVGALAAALSGCSSSEPGPRPSSAAATTSSASVASPDPKASAGDAALEAYRGFWDAQVAAQRDPTQPVPEELRKYAIDTALTDEQSAILLYRKEGIRFRGEPVLSPEIADVLLADPPLVTIRDCVDSSQWIPVFAATGQSALAPGQPSRVAVESLATVYAGRWVIRKHTVLREQTC